MNDVEFNSIDEVDQFYSFYSLATGFSIRKNKLDKNRAGTLVLIRQLVCSKEGVRRGFEVRWPDVEVWSQQLVDESNWQDGWQIMIFSSEEQLARQEIAAKRQGKKRILRAVA